jgi:hypothetical protein
LKKRSGEYAGGGWDVKILAAVLNIMLISLVVYLLITGYLGKYAEAILILLLFLAPLSSLTAIFLMRKERHKEERPIRF